MNPSGSSSSHGQQRPPPSSSSRPPGSSTAPQSSSTPNSNNPQSSGTYHDEDRLYRAWRSVASSVVLATQRADRTAQQQQQPLKENMKELDEAVVGFLRFRKEFGRYIAHVEAKIQGKAQEIETLDCYLRSQPRLGRKRKRAAAQASVDNTTSIGVPQDVAEGAVLTVGNDGRATTNEG